MVHPRRQLGTVIEIGHYSSFMVSKKSTGLGEGPLEKKFAGFGTWSLYSEQVIELVVLLVGAFIVG